MATAKITVTLEQDDEGGTNEGMARTIGLLAQLGIQPTQKLVLTLECEEEDAEMHRDDLKLALRARPVGINVKIKTAIEEEVERERMVPVTPMDKAWSN